MNSSKEGFNALLRILDDDEVCMRKVKLDIKSKPIKMNWGIIVELISLLNNEVLSDLLVVMLKICLTTLKYNL